MTSPPAGAVVIVPARAGSKGLIGKNTRPLLGKPLAQWTLEAARDAARVTRVVVTTDDPVVARLARALGADVVDRPPALAGDDASIVDATLHAAAAAEIGADQTIALLQPTSPLRDAAEVDAAIARFEKAGREGSVMSVCEADPHPLKALLLAPDGVMVPVSGRPETLSAQRQALPRAVRQNGAVYVLRLAALAQRRSFFAPPCRAHPMPRARSIDIDDLEDFEACARLLRKDRDVKAGAE